MDKQEEEARFLATLASRLYVGWPTGDSLKIGLDQAARLLQLAREKVTRSSAPTPSESSEPQPKTDE